jgi:hypothetical protein
MLPGQFKEERLFAGARAIGDDHHDRLGSVAGRLTRIGRELSFVYGRETEKQKGAGESFGLAHGYSTVSS